MTLRPLRTLLMAGAGWTALAAGPALAATCQQQFEQVRAELAQSQFSGAERREYHALLQAARAMQQNGDQQVCVEILDRTRGLLQQRSAGASATSEAAVEDPQARAARYAALENAQPFAQIARFESIRDLGVVNPKGERLGQIIDLVIDFGNHQVQYALLSMSSGFFGDQKVYPVPIDVLRIGADPGPAPGPAGSEPPTAQTERPDGTAALGMIAHMTVGELVGSEVKNDRGDSVGEIDAMILPSDAAQIEAVLSVGGVLGIGDKSVALPLERLTMTEDGLRLKQPVTEDELKQLPKVEISEQERLPDETVIAEVVPAAAAPGAGGASTAPGGGAPSAPASGAGPDAQATGSGSQPAGQPATAEGAPPDNPLARKVLVLDLDRATLEQAPGFSDGAYPDLADAEWHRTVLSFYENVLNIGEPPAKTMQPGTTAKTGQPEAPAKSEPSAAPAKSESPDAPANSKQP